jgi:hypothetical protein
MDAASWLDILRNDLRYAARKSWRSQGFTIIPRQGSEEIQTVYLLKSQNGRDPFWSLFGAVLRIDSIFAPA